MWCSTWHLKIHETITLIVLRRKNLAHHTLRIPGLVHLERICVLIRSFLFFGHGHSRFSYLMNYGTVRFAQHTVKALCCVLSCSTGSDLAKYIRTLPTYPQLNAHFLMCLSVRVLLICLRVKE